jgi:hypothetical protein
MLQKVYDSRVVRGKKMESFFPTLFFGALRHVKRVYDVHQHIFSDEGEYALDMHHIFSQHVVLREALR